MKAQKLILLCIVLLFAMSSQAFASDSTPDMHFSFENFFSCDYTGNNSLTSYGNMAFESIGVTGKALDLQDGYLTITGSESITFKDSFTFAGWVNFHEMTCGCPMFFSRTASNGDPCNGPVCFALTDDYERLKADITFLMPDGSYASHTFYTDPIIYPPDMIDKWHHVAVVFDKTTLTFYLDGVIVCTEMLPEALQSYESIANNNQPICIGRGFGTNITAKMDEIHFCCRALPYEEVSALRYVVIPEEQTTIILTEGYNTVWVNDQRYLAPDIVRRDSETDELMIPIKAVMQHMGATFNWDGNDRMGRIDIAYKGTAISVWVMDVYANLNGNRLLKLSCPPANYSDSIFAPASLLTDGFGIETEWDETNKQLIIKF